jgi:putative endonuclease
VKNDSGAKRVARTRELVIAFAVIASAAKQSSAQCKPPLDCFVALLLAMTGISFCERYQCNDVMKQPAVYLMANRRNGTLYVGVTSNLPQRAWQHRTGLVGGFTLQHGCKLLVWYEIHGTMYDAITREKQIKGGSRQKKLTLIEAMNPSWRDLYDELA